MTENELAARLGISVTGLAAHIASARELNEAIALVRWAEIAPAGEIDGDALTAAYALIEAAAAPEPPEDWASRQARQDIATAAHAAHRKVYGGLG